MAPFGTEVEIHYSEHFTPEGNECDGATPGVTQPAAAPTWVTLEACSVGDGYVRLVASDTGHVIEDVSVTITPRGVVGQAPLSVALSGVTSTELKPGGSKDRFTVRAEGLSSAKTYELNTVALNGISVAFDRGCSDFKETETIRLSTIADSDYDAYGCAAPGTYLWAWVEEVGGSAIAATGLHDHFLNVADPTVSFSSRSYSVKEGEDRDITVRLSHPTGHRLRIPVTVTNGTAQSDDYSVSGLTRGELTFKPHDTSESFTISASEDTDSDDDETVNLGFGTLPSHVSAGSTRTATLTIDDVPPPNSDPVISGPASVFYRENRTDRVAAYTASDDDGDTISWSLSGIDADDLGISSSGVLTFNSSPNYESPRDRGRNNVYEVTVKASDGRGGTDNHDVTVTVTDVNERPRITSGPGSVTYPENRTYSAATYAASDPDGDSISWSLFGADRDDFRISSTGVLTFRNTPDYENPADSNGNNKYLITVRASDGRGGTDDRNVTVTVTNRDPTIDSGPYSVSYAEGRTFAVGAYTASDPGGGSISWSLSGTDAGDFRISSTGVLTFRSTPNYENPHDRDQDNEYLITVTASDGSSSDNLDVTVTVTNVNEPPFVKSIIGDRTMTAGATTTIDLSKRFGDPDGDALRYTARSSDDSVVNAGIDGNTLTLGALSAGSASVTVTAADGGRLTATNSFTVTVKPPPPLPSKPKINQGLPGSQRGWVVLDWNSTSNTNGYRVLQLKDGTYTELSSPSEVSIDFEETTAVVLGLDPDVEHIYSFKVKAVNNHGSSLSDPFTVNIRPPPQNLIGEYKDGEYGKLTLTWDVVSNPSATYIVEQHFPDIIPFDNDWHALPHDGVSATITILSDGKMQAVIGPLAVGATFKHRVRANSVQGISEPSNEAETTVKDEGPEKPTGLASRPRSTGKLDLEWNDAKLALYWNPVPDAGVTYEVQQKKPRFSIVPDAWETLPFDGFTLNGSSDGNVSITDLNVLIGGLEFDKSYEHRVRSLRGGQASKWSDTLKTRLPLPFIGHQADHTVQYVIGTPAPAPTSGGPPLPDPRIVIPKALDHAIEAWNSEVASSSPQVLFCESGKCGKDRLDDGRTVIINVSSVSGCGDLSACVRFPDGAAADADGHMNNLEIVIEEPASVPLLYRGLKNPLRLVWTSDPGMHHETVKGMNALYAYLPQVFMHELGHASGLHDLYRFDQRRYRGYLMGLHRREEDAHTSIPDKDLDYLREVYRNHTPHPMQPSAR